MRIATTEPRRRRGAFTLMEVLVVVAILVVLAGVGGVIFLNVQQDAYKDAARIQIRELTEAAQRYAVKNGGELPGSLAELVPGLLEQKALMDPWQKPYQYSAESQHHPAGTNKPDIWTTAPKTNEMIGNW